MNYELMNELNSVLSNMHLHWSHLRQSVQLLIWTVTDFGGGCTFLDNLRTQSVRYCLLGLFSLLYYFLHSSFPFLHILFICFTSSYAAKNKRLLSGGKARCMTLLYFWRRVIFAAASESPFASFLRGSLTSHTTAFSLLFPIWGHGDSLLSLTILNNKSREKYWQAMGKLKSAKCKLNYCRSFLKSSELFRASQSKTGPVSIFFLGERGSGYIQVSAVTKTGLGFGTCAINTMNLGNIPYGLSR